MKTAKRVYFSCPDCNHRWSVDALVYKLARLDKIWQRRAVALASCGFIFCKKCGSQGDVVKD